MATNKNQHFVPRCYLRPFTKERRNTSINLYNVDRRKFISGAPVKNQCSGNYFYGKDVLLERAIQGMEGHYAQAAYEIQAASYKLTDDHRAFLRRFWLLQHMRTEAASKRTVEMMLSTGAAIGADLPELRTSVKEAVQTVMRIFVAEMDAVDDLKVCLIRNRTEFPFVTSDDPAILSNRWYLEDRRTRNRSFGLRSSGALFLLPISPRVLCIGYDGDVYTIPNTEGWVDVRVEADVKAFNQLQYLNCWANIFVRDEGHAQWVHESYVESSALRPSVKHVINYAVLDGEDEDGNKRYRRVDREKTEEHTEALVHFQSIRPVPSAWPKQIRFRTHGAVFTNDSAAGYIRRSHVARKGRIDYRKEIPRG